MSHKYWSTEEDVLKDLELFGMKVTNIHGDVFVQGQGPPPPMISVEDDQPQPGGEGLHDNIASPDLKGITKMLKYVNEHDKDDNDEILTNGQPYDRECVMTISKLNPNVAEFVPKMNSNVTDGIINKNTDLSDENMCNKLKNNVKQGENVKDGVIVNQGVNVNSTISNNLININNEEREKLAQQLKNKICCKDNIDTYQSKKEKNIAIISLLKLCSKPIPQLEKDNTPKLYTPDYFIKSKSKAEATEPSNSDVELNNKYHINVISSQESTKIAPEETTPSLKFDVSLEVEQSIKKVTNWLNPTAPKPKKSVYLGRIAFKRKEPASKSSNSGSEKTLSMSSNSTTTPEYKPSKHADELVKKYSDRQKDFEVMKFMDPISKLVEELKNRDKLIRQRALDLSASKFNRQ